MPAWLIILLVAALAAAMGWARRRHVLRREGERRVQEEIRWQRALDRERHRPANEGRHGKDTE